MNGTCLVILGDVSGNQQRHDDLLELVILPAVQRRDLEVQRENAADGESIYDAAVCIVDAAGLDAAIAFHCGRRHEAARPVIQLADSADVWLLPEVRTVIYDLESPRGVHEASRQIERHLDDAQAAPRASMDLETLHSAIGRVERKLDQIAGRERYRESGEDREPAEHTLEDLMRSPQEAFLAAVGDGRMDEAVRHLIQMQQTGGVRIELVAAAALVATSGYQAGADILEEILIEHRPELDPVEFNSAVGAYIRFHVRADREGDALAKIGGLLDQWLEEPDMEASDRAYLHNQVQMLHWGNNDVDTAVEHAREAISLNPEQPAYKYNLSMLLEARGEFEEAEKMVDEYMATEHSQSDGDHLSQAVDIYLQRGRLEQARDAYERLRDVDPSAARIKHMLNPDIAKLLAS